MRRRLIVVQLLALCLLGTSCVKKGSMLPHPIFKQKTWTKQGTEENKVRDPNKFEVLWRKSVFYQCQVGNKFLVKSEHKYFDRYLILKAYGIRSAEGNLLEHWVSIKDEKNHWKIFKTDCGEPECYKFRQFVVRDTDGFVIGVNLIIETNDGELVFRRFVKRMAGIWLEAQ